MDYLRWEGRPQGVEHGQNVDDFLSDAPLTGFKWPVAAKAMPMTLSAMPTVAAIMAATGEDGGLVA